MAFARATSGASHSQTLELVAAWRFIALDPRFPAAARLVAFNVRSAKWRKDHVRLALHVAAEDIIRHSPHKEARCGCAYNLKDLGTNAIYDATNAEPVGAILAAADRAAGDESEWTRLYCYAFSVCDAVSGEPITVDRRMRHDSPEVLELLTRFNEWAVDLEDRLPARDRGAERAMRVELQALVPDHFRR